MTRQKGSMSVNANFEVKAAAPLDARYVVSSKNNLTDSDTWVTDGLAYIYVGMQVYVSTEHKLYMLIGSDYTNINNWTEITSGGNVFTYRGDVSTYSSLPLTGNISGDIYYIEDKQVNYYYNGTTWISLGNPNKSFYVWKIQSALGNLNSTVSVPLDSLTRADDLTITATINDITVGKSMVADVNGIIGIVTGFNNNNANVVITTVTIDTKSDGVHLVDTTLNTTIGGTTTLTGITISNLVLNETLVYDTNGTIAAITARNNQTGNLIATTITTSSIKLGDAFISSNALNRVIGSTTSIPIIAITGLTEDAIVLNNTIISDNYGTLGIIISRNGNNVTIKTLTTDTKSDGVYKTNETLDTTISSIQTLNINTIEKLDINNIIINQTLIFDNNGTIAKVNNVNKDKNEIIVEVITFSGIKDIDEGSLKNELKSTQNVGGIKIGDTFAAGTDFETIFRAILNPINEPELTNPSAILSVNEGTLLENGASANKIFTCDFNRGSINPAYTTDGYRSGAAISYTLNGGNAQMGNTWVETVSQKATSYQATVKHGAGEQPTDEAGNKYDNAYPAGEIKSNTINFEFVDALWANTEDISTVAKLPLVSKNERKYEFNFPSQTIEKAEIFDVPSDWEILKVEVFNDLSGNYQDCLDEFTITNISHNNAAGAPIKYKRYTNNRGYAAGARKIRIIWS